MKPIGVHFTAESIERILDGRKTETRRVLQKQPTLASATMKRLIEEQKEKGVIHWSEGLKDRAIPWQWRVGRELWVRETWRTFERKPDGLDGILYAADGSFIPIESTKEAADQWVVAHANGRHQGRWRPALFLPQWAARIRLRVVAARAERLHEMTNVDARAEGVGACGPGGDCSCDRDRFARLWDGLHADDAPWDTNPWVAVIQFERTEVRTAYENTQK